LFPHGLGELDLNEDDELELLDDLDDERESEMEFVRLMSLETEREMPLGNGAATAVATLPMVLLGGA